MKTNTSRSAVAILSNKELAKHLFELSAQAKNEKLPIIAKILHEAAKRLNNE